jgi:hypothetical protein
MPSNNCPTTLSLLVSKRTIHHCEKYRNPIREITRCVKFIVSEMGFDVMIFILLPQHSSQQPLVRLSELDDQGAVRPSSTQQPRL